MIHEPKKYSERLTSSRCCRIGAFACSDLQDVHLSLGHWISWKDPEPAKLIEDGNTKSTPKIRTGSSVGMLEQQYGMSTCSSNSKKIFLEERWC